MDSFQYYQPPVIKKSMRKVDIFICVGVIIAIGFLLYTLINSSPGVSADSPPCCLTSASTGCSSMCPKLTQSYPDSNGKFKQISAEKVKAFQDNVGSLINTSWFNEAIFNTISKTPINDNSEDRLLLADYLSRVYNGTSKTDLLRLTMEQLTDIIKSLEYIYDTPNMPAVVQKYFDGMRRYSQEEVVAGGTGCVCEKGKPCLCQAANTVWSAYPLPFDSSPVTMVTSNWTADNPQAYLFQTIMRKGTGSFGSFPGRQWWGSYSFSDPTRASLRRGMLNSPQNSSKFYDERFGFGGIPCNTLFEGAIMPIDSAFAPPGSIATPLGMPNVCNPTQEAKCVPNEKSTRPAAVYTYFIPGSGIFFNSKQCAYMYNFVDGILNIPEKAYSDKKSQFNGKTVPPTMWNELLSKRLPNGLPDHVLGVSKILLYLLRKMYSAPDAVKAALADKANWSSKEAQLMTDPKYPITTNLEIRLPLEADKALARAGIKNGGLGLEGNTDPTDTRAPPRAYIGARSIHAQVAALMGVYTHPPKQAPESMSGGQRFAAGLFTPDGKVKPSDCPFIDKRKYAMGWINGRWYGYPPVGNWELQSAGHRIPGAGKNYPGGSRKLQQCEKMIGAGYTPSSKTSYVGGGIYSKGGVSGIPGAGPSGNSYNNEKWDGQWFMPTEDNPLIYYGFKDGSGKPEELYRTWYGKPISMGYEAACKMIGMFYSMGDTGWEEGPVCWPFGSYFAYAEDLGIGKYIIGGNLLSTFGAQSLHYTMTSTSLAKGQLVSPAYDYEIVLTLDDPSIKTIQCFCKKYVQSVNLMYDNGKYLKDYVSPAKGALGGTFPPEAGTDYDGSDGLSNFTEVLSATQFLEKEAQYLKDGVQPIDKQCWCRNKKSVCKNMKGESKCNSASGCSWEDGDCVDLCQKATDNLSDCPDDCYAKYKDTSPQSSSNKNPIQDTCLFASFDNSKPNMMTGKSNRLVGDGDYGKKSDLSSYF